MHPMTDQQADAAMAGTSPVDPGTQAVLDDMARRFDHIMREHLPAVKPAQQHPGSIRLVRA